MCPILDHLSFLPPSHLVKELGGVFAEPGEEGQVVRSSYNVDRIDLDNPNPVHHPPEVASRGLPGRTGIGKPLGGQRQPARLSNGEPSHGRDEGRQPSARIFAGLGVENPRRSSERLVLRGSLRARGSEIRAESTAGSLPAVIGRYSLPEMASIWSDTHRLETWQRVELLALEAWAKLGVVPPEVAERLAQAQTPTPEAVAEREKITDHDLAAFVDLLADATGEGGEWVHYGLTSSDVLDTALGYQMGEATDLLINAIGSLFSTVRQVALAEWGTPMIGRTHGIWAEPTTFGLKLASWAFELVRAHQRMSRARQAVRVGKISGAVGTYAHTPPQIEAYVCEQMGLGVEPASSQVTARDRHAEFLAAIALTGATLERMATEIRHLQRSEVGEVREPFGSGQKGSSAMPHKRNPIVSERITGMARLLRGYAQTGFENVALWHERDISHSSAERVALPDASLLLYYMLIRMNRLIDGLVIDRERMKSNLAATKGLVYSQAVLLALIETGMARDQAYRIVQENATKAWESDHDLATHLGRDPRVTLSKADLEDCFESARFLREVEVVRARLENLPSAL